MDLVKLPKLEIIQSSIIVANVIYFYFFFPLIFAKHPPIYKCAIFLFSYEDAKSGPLKSRCCTLKKKRNK